MKYNQEIGIKSLRDLARLGAIQEFSLEQIQISHKNIIQEKENSKVYKSQLHGQLVAIEVLDQKEKIIKQLEGIKNHAILNHPNVLILYGFSFHYNRLYLVYPFQNKGSLDSCIHEINQIKDAQERQEIIIDILIDIAKGIKYLHSKQIIHRDLNPRNILLDSNFNAKICNLDYSLKQGHYSPFIVHNEDYNAPEFNQNPPLNSEKNDIYGFGKIAFFLFGNINKYQFVQSCINQDPNERPSIDQLLYNLNSLKREKIGKGQIKHKTIEKKENNITNQFHSYIYDLILYVFI